jgi:hypothetical protein
MCRQWTHRVNNVGIDTNQNPFQNMAARWGFLLLGSKRFRRKWFELAMTIFVFTGAAFAQSGNQGSVQGTVRDTSGAVIANASVKVQSEASGAIRTAKTNDEGFFAVESLEPGSYSVTISAQGFSTSVTQGEAIAPGQQRTIITTLAVGTSAQQVTVEANAVEVETQSSANSSTITSKQVSNLMLNGRNFQALGQLAPGVTSTQSGNQLPGGGLGGGTNLIVNGNSIEYTVYTLDGVEDMNTGNLSNLNILPITEAIQEFSVLSDNYSAKYGFSGSGQIIVQTKSGGSTYHGSAWNFLRNDAFDANNYFDIKKASLHQNIYGYTFSGPIPKLTKTFFFAANEWRKASIGQTATGAVFTPAMLTGDMSGSPTLPAGGLTLDAHSQALLASEGLTNCVSSPTTLSPACLNKVSTTLYSTYVPSPNNPGGGFNNYINQNPEKLSQLDYDYRIDHSFTPNEILTARAMYEEADQSYPYDAWAGHPFSTTTDAYYTTGSNLLVRMNSVITPNFDNIASIAYSDDKPRIRNTSGNTALPSGLSIAQYFPDADPYNRIPNISISKGFSGLGVSSQPIHASDGEGILSDDVNWVKGNHVLQFGAMYVFGIKRQNVFTYPQGSFSFSGVHTGDPAADYLLGLDASYSQNDNQKSGSYHYRQGEVYAQDDWKATSKLTLNMGLRWFYFSQDTVSGNQVTNFELDAFNASEAPAVTISGNLVTNSDNVPVTVGGQVANLTNGLVFAGQNGASSGFFTPSKLAFAPRVGFAYALGNNNDTSIRGGYGIGYTRLPVEQIYGMFGQNPPYNSSANILNSLIDDGTAGTAGAPTPQSLDAIDTKKVGPAQTQSYSLSVQHQVMPAGILTVAYAGSVSRHLESQVYNQNQVLPVSAPSTTGCLAPGQAASASYQFDPCINTGAASANYTVPYPGYSGISTQTFLGNSNYNSLQTHFVYRTDTLQIDSAYTYSKVLTNLGGSQGAGGGGSISIGAQNWRNLAAENGPPDWDRTDVLTTSIVYNIPAFQHARPLLRETLGGWSFAGLAILESGFALSPGLSTSSNGQATRPDALSHEKKVGKLQEWFDTSRYQQAPYGFYGNAANGSIRGPAEFTGNTALYKTFSIQDRASIQFRAEAFNVANHPNWAAVSTGYGAGNFGAVTSALDPRILEFALRVTF